MVGPQITHSYYSTGQDFVQRLLEWAPEERMTMADAMEHQWLIVSDHELQNSASNITTPEGIDFDDSDIEI